MGSFQITRGGSHSLGVTQEREQKRLCFGPVPDASPTSKRTIDTFDQVQNLRSRPLFGVVIVSGRPQLMSQDESVNDLEQVPDWSDFAGGNGI